MPIRTIKPDIKVGDFYTFKSQEGFYYSFFCSLILRDKSPHSFYFVPTTYKSVEKPTIDALKSERFYGHEGGFSSSLNINVEEYIKEQQPDIYLVWQMFPQKYMYQLCVYNIYTIRSNFLKMETDLEKIGSIPMRENLVKLTVGGVGGWSMTDLNNFFKDLPKLMDYRNQQEYPLSLVIKE